MKSTGWVTRSLAFNGYRFGTEDAWLDRMDAAFDASRLDGLLGELVAKLDAVIIAFDRVGERLDRRGLGQAWCALDQQVSVGEQGDEQSVHELGLPEHCLIQVAAQASEGRVGIRVV